MGFIGELKRRNVFRVGTAYIVGAWVLLQAAELLFDILDVPEVALKWVLAVLVLGAPVVLILTWAYEWTPDGIRPDPGSDLQRRSAKRSGRNFDFAVIALLLFAVAYFSIDKFFLHEHQPAQTTSEFSEFDRSVAALPFVNHGSDPDSLAFASGIHDDLLTQLAKIANLRVISNTSVREYAGTTKNVRQIGAELSVRHVLEGGVQKAGDRIRVNVQLIDATTDNHLWAETYDRELSTENIFAIQSEIAREIARTLRVSLSPATSEALDGLPTDNLEAYKDYVAGLLILDEVVPALHPSRFEQGIELLKSAVAKDPQFSLAWARLAGKLHIGEIYLPDFDFGMDPRTALARAQEIEPGLPQIHLVLALFALSDYRFQEALDELEQAERGLPGDSLVYGLRYAVLRNMGRYEEAFVNIRRALALDPKELGIVQNYGYALIQTRRYDDARAFLITAIETMDNDWDLRRQHAELDFYQHGDNVSSVEVWMASDAPREAAFYEFFVASLYWDVGDLPSAVAHAKVATGGFEGRWSFFTADELRAWIFRDAGLDTESRAAAESARQKALRSRDQQPDSPAPFLALARLRALEGDNAGALELAEKSTEVAQSLVANGVKAEFVRFRIDHARTLCLAGAFETVENVWREILSEQNAWTLASLMSNWLPCKRLMLDTEHYWRLEAEFGHLSDGASAMKE